MSAKVISQDRKQLETTLNRLIRYLVEKKYTFVTLGDSCPQIQQQLAKYDNERVNLSQEIFGFIIDIGTMPEFLKIITQHVVSFGTEQTEDQELINLQRLMRSSFPVCAVGFSKLYGPRFLTIIHGETISYQGFITAMSRFEQINHNIMPLGGRLTLKLFGKAIAGINSSAATGSIIILATSTKRAEQLRQWVKDQHLRNDTMLNQLKARARSPKFWAKAIVGMIEYQPHQLRQEIIVLDLNTGRVTSSASPRLTVEFGFSLDQIGRK